ncbi:MAG: hypothetical protein NTY99_01715 [DPANN group archaeon]|nr:hypothetical protein [DPANN group archaeon]
MAEKTKDSDVLDEILRDNPGLNKSQKTDKGDKMADEDTKQPKPEEKAIVPSKDEQPAPEETPGDANEEELPDINALTRYEVPVAGKDKPAVVYADPITNQIIAYAIKFPSKDANKSATEGIMYILEDGAWSVKDGSPDAAPYANVDAAVAKAMLYQTSLDKLLADRKAAKKAAEPKPVPTEASTKEDEPGLETIVAPVAPAPEAKEEYQYVFKSGMWNDKVAVYNAG